MTVEVINNNNNNVVEKTTENQKEDVDKRDSILFNFDKLKPEEIKRGETPADINKKCLDVVQSYLAGVWLKAADETEITVSRISGGLTNQIYRVQLNDSVLKRVKETDVVETPTDVAIKFYMSKLIANYNKEDDERLSDTIVLTILSELGLGPKVYGIFAGGYVQEYVDVSVFFFNFIFY